MRELLEKLDLTLDDEGRPGFGSNNLLFMACELLLLTQEDEGNRMLLIEEPEAHLHPQRQLRVMRYLQQQADERHIQIIVTTHSPNLASAINLRNLVMIHRGRAFPMAEGQTKLHISDYRFLERFLDVTKANLFFARGVLVVEGDAESILLPTLARLIGRGLTDHGVSIVNVGGVGLRRYACILQREYVEEDGELGVPVACITDRDVMPDCAPVIVGRIESNDPWPGTARRRWRARRDFPGDALAGYVEAKAAKVSGQNVRTFVSDEWTLEYDLALGPRDGLGTLTGGLAEDVFVAAYLAESDDDINAGATHYDRLRRMARAAAQAVAGFDALKVAVAQQYGTSADEVLASEVCAKFVRDGVSKAVAAQYLAERLERKQGNRKLAPDALRRLLPRHLVSAIDFVTSAEAAAHAGTEAVHG